MQFKRIKRDVSGVLLLDKPLGYSSNQALQKIKWLYQAAKAGHTGTLDPLATGVLPICLGEATKFAQYLTDADKTYEATMRLGVTTTTGDAEGEVLEVLAVHVNHQQLASVCQQFVGEISQTPPMYSALKHEGKPLYEYARSGIEITREARRVTIESIDILQLDGDVAQTRVRCSKGTYIRTLAEDIGKALGCGAHLIALRRSVSAGHQIAQTIKIEALEALSLADRDKLLMPVDTAIKDLSSVIISNEAAHYLLQGQPIRMTGVIPQGELRLYDARQRFLGVGVLQSDGKIAPKRLLQIKIN